MAYPTDKPSGNYALRNDNFAESDSNKIPMDNNLWKHGYKNADESEVESVPDAHEQNWLFDVLHRNLKYTQETAEENKRLLESKVATPTSIGQVKIGYGLEITSNGVLSVSKSVAEDANIISYDLPVGSYMLWSGTNTPEYFITPSGQTLLRSSYPELWEFANNNNLIGKLFGVGDGSTTFTVTNIQNTLNQSIKNIPDYNSGIGVGNPLSNSRFYAPEDGIYVATGGLNSALVQLYINDVGTAFVTRDDATGLAYNNVSVPLKKGDNIFWSSTLNIATSVFYPYRRETFETNSFNSYGLKIILKALPTPPSNTVPTGTILDYTGAVAPDGYIVANGAELSRSTFSKLFQWVVANNLMKDQSTIPTTAHGYYGTGDGSTTFTIPDLRGVFKRGADLASNRGGTVLGAYQPDGLPNITGSLPTIYNQSVAYERGRSTISGAFGGSRISDTQGSGSGVMNLFNVNLNASLSSPIYGNSDTVQPKSVSILPILKY